MGTIIPKNVENIKHLTPKTLSTVCLKCPKKNIKKGKKKGEKSTNSRVPFFAQTIDKPICLCYNTIVQKNLGKEENTMTNNVNRNAIHINVLTSEDTKA